jgi:acyl-CoA reductase-like NAD-dependent aldehyde dehydrogenase
VAPTVAVDVPLAAELATEEVFGPVVAVTAVDSFDEAVHRANSSRYGLSASLFSRDLARALEFSRRIQAGIVKINQESTGLEPHVPFGGVKASSSGSAEQGKAAREFFTTWKTTYVDWSTL